jgi:hypothetical protein
VEQLRSNGAEIIVLLSHQGLEQDEALASAVPGIDLIVGASTQSFLQSPRAAGGAKIVQLSSKGQVFGLAVLERAPKSSTTNLSLSKVVDLDARFDAIPAGGEPNPMKGIISRMNLEISEMNRKQSDELWNQQASRQPMFSTQVSCTSCHSEQAKFQAKHQHSAAFFTLTARGKEKSLDCLSCHSVGLGAEGGFTGLGDAIVDKNGKYLSYQDILKAAGLDRLPADLSYKKTPKLAQEHAERWNQALTKAKVKHSFVNVQCESCHGPRPGHPFNNAGSSQLSKVKAVSCLQCHTSQQMPSWYGKDGKPLEPIVRAAMKKLACPSMQ